MDNEEARLVEYLATPYILTMEPVQAADGHWTCRAEYPELEGCEAEALAPEQAVESLEAKTAAYLRRCVEKGTAPGVRRPILPYLMPEARRQLKTGSGLINEEGGTQ